MEISPPVFFKAAFEVSLLSLFVVCLAHSYFTHGWKRTVREFVAGFFLTACCESTGVLSGAYVYPGFHWYVFATPVANPASWIATVYIIIEVTNRLVYGKKALETYEVDGFKMRAALTKLGRQLAEQMLERDPRVIGVDLLNIAFKLVYDPDMTKG